MAVYLLNVIGIIIGSAFFKATFPRDKAIRYILVFATFQMVIIASLRGISVGTDTQTYGWIFSAAGKMGWRDLFNYYIEFGYMIINKIVSIATSNFQFLLCVNAIIIYGTIFWAIKKISFDPIFSIYLFIFIGYFTSTMNIMRQYIAIGLILISYFQYIKGSNWKKIVLLILLAACIHRISIIMPLIFIFYRYIYQGKMIVGNNYRQLLSVFLMILAMFAIARYGDSLFGFIGRKFYDYDPSINVKNVGVGYETQGFGVNQITKIVFSILFYLIRKRCLIDEKDLENLDFLNFLNVISIFITFMSGVVPLFSRLNIFFSIIIVVFIPNLLRYVKNSFFIKAGLWVLFAGYWILTLPGKDVYPWVMY